MSRKLDTGALTPRTLISSGRRHGIPFCHRPEAMAERLDGKKRLRTAEKTATKLHTTEWVVNILPLQIAIDTNMCVFFRVD
ncbi:hypothetical protein [Methylosinus sp. C49]|uniref:hypothetical protein n=1 Tax=Methylosinus sp. C49 TaxID=2699395 RepID=UPI00137A1154|nr:hypothetical protein [Methylosinus sp. C49]